MPPLLQSSKKNTLWAIFIYLYATIPLWFIPMRQTFLEMPGLLKFFNILFTVSLLLTPVMIPYELPKWVRRGFYLLINSLAFFIALGAGLTGELPGPTALAAAARTDLREASSLLLSAPMLSTTLILSWLLQFAGLLFLKELPHIHFNGKWKRFSGLLFMPLMLPMFFGDLRLTYPGALPNMLAKTYEYNSFKNHVLASTIPDVQPLEPAQNDVVVLVIGESSSAEYWQIGGYSQPTSPYTYAREKKGELIYFPHHMSAASSTFVAVPNLLTPNGKLVPPGTTTYNPSLVSLMKKGGRETAWLSTQSPQLASTEADKLVFKDGYFSFLTTDVLDELLLPDFEGWLKSTAARPSFAVLHTEGSHIPFEYRYPEKFKKWPTLGGTFPTSQSVNNYLNSILYTDYFLENVIERLEKESRPALFMYVSDHGETIMKGLMRSAAPAGPNVLHVPFMVWANKAWREAHPQKWALLSKQAKELPVTHHLDITPTLMDLAGYKYAGQPSERDMLSSSYTPWKTVPVFEVDLTTVKQLPAVGELSPPSKMSIGSESGQIVKVRRTELGVP